MANSLTAVKRHAGQAKRTTFVLPLLGRHGCRSAENLASLRKGLPENNP
jgi:hypothetical protein